jgi:3,4-dihydroxy 2-butanone 4-phosphate synthase/GTP cyclohydrolase II
MTEAVARIARDESIPSTVDAGMLDEVVRVPLPTTFGVFTAHAFQHRSGRVYVALVSGEIDDGRDVLVRLHSECLTGDVLGSLRCDCGVQLREGLRALDAQGRGVLVYVTGHEGRGIGLVNKLRAYVEQDNGADTVDANLRLGLPVDSRDYGPAASVLEALGVRSVRLLTNNPAKVASLRDAGIVVSEVVALASAPHARNQSYLRTKERRLGHHGASGTPATQTEVTNGSTAIDATELLGEVRPRADRPYVAVKYAQSLDGRIATSTGDSKWISGPDERRLAHALRAASDAVLIGIGTVITDNPLLTVRDVAGASPRRVVLDSTLRIPDSAQILETGAGTTVITTERSAARRRDELRDRGVRVEVVPSGPDGIEIRRALAVLRDGGTTSLLVEGGSHVITSMLSARIVDRLIVGIAPVVIGEGTPAVGPLGISLVADAVRLRNRVIHALPDDLIVAGDIAPCDDDAASSVN